MGIQTHQAKLHQPQAKSQDKAQPARPWGSQNLGPCWQAARPPAGSWAAKWICPNPSRPRWSVLSAWIFPG